MVSGWRKRLWRLMMTVAPAKPSMLIVATVLGAGAGHAQPLGAAPPRPAGTPSQAATTPAATRVEVGLTAWERPFPVASGQLIAGEISPGDISSGPGWSGDLLTLHALADQVVTFQLKSTIPGVEVNVQLAKSLIPRPVVRGPANAAPLRLVVPKEADYKIYVYATGAERFGNYLLSIGSEQGAPSFDTPKPAPTQIAVASKPTASPAAPRPTAALPKLTSTPTAPTAAEPSRVATPVASVDRTAFERLVEKSGQSFVGAKGSLDIYTEGDALVLHYGSVEQPRAHRRWKLARQPGTRKLTILEHLNMGPGYGYIAELTPEGYLRFGITYDNLFSVEEIVADHPTNLDLYHTKYTRKNGWQDTGDVDTYRLRSDKNMVQARQDRADLQEARAEKAAFEAEMKAEADASKARADAAFQQTLQSLGAIRAQQQREYDASVARTEARLADARAAQAAQEAQRLRASQERAAAIAQARSQPVIQAPVPRPASPAPQSPPRSAAAPPQTAQVPTTRPSQAARPQAASAKAAKYSYCIAYGVKVAYVSPVFPTREAWSPLDAARAFKARLDSSVRDPQCAGALSEASVSAQRASTVARDGKVMRIVDVPFSW